MSVNQDRQLPTGKVPCSRCGLPVAAGDPLVGGWSSADGVLQKAIHRPDRCLPALAEEVLALRELCDAQQNQIQQLRERTSFANSRIASAQGDPDAC